jgi:hypothetical protein
LVDRGEAHSHLRLNRHRPDDLQVLGTLDRVVEQRRLPHSGLPSKDQCPAHSGPHAVEHLVERLLFRVAVNQQHPTPLSLIALCVTRQNYSGTTDIRQGPDVGALTEQQGRPESYAACIT